MPTLSILFGMIEKFISPWKDIDEISPDETDTAMLKNIQVNPDCQSFVSQDEVIKELGL